MTDAVDATAAPSRDLLFVAVVAWPLLPLGAYMSAPSRPSGSIWMLGMQLLTWQMCGHLAIGVLAMLFAHRNGRTRTRVALVAGAAWTVNLIITLYASIAFGGAPL